MIFKRSLRILFSFSGLIFNPKHFSGELDNNSSGGSTSGTSGTLATFNRLCAKYCDKGVFDVLETPTKTISAFKIPLGSRPSSYLTANSSLLLF